MRGPGGPESLDHSGIRVSAAGFPAGAVPGADNRQCLKISTGLAGCRIRGLGGGDFLFKAGATNSRRTSSLAQCASHHHQLLLGSERRATLMHPVSI